MIGIICVYLVVICCFIYGVLKLPKTKVDTELTPNSFSIIIPFRNEEANLINLLKTIEALKYPLANFEILLIDDASTDTSVSILKKHLTSNKNVRILNNQRFSNSPKKDAIQVGIKASKFKWILTTDADCELPENWLHAYNSCIHQKQSLFVAGPIKLKASKKRVQQYQKLDTLSLLASTMGSFGIQQPMMCNAANMGFEKQTYLQLQNTHTHIASGDDVFTLENFFKTTPSKVHYLNTIDAVVSTYAETSWKAVLQQRVRWAAKSTHYKNIFTKLVGVVVLLTQLTLVLGIFIKPKTILYFWSLKLVFDAILITISSKKINEQFSILSYFFVAIVYPFLNTYIGIKALFGGYVWKQRYFKR